MTVQVDTLMDSVLRLPTAERCALTAALIDSLPSGDDASVSEAWRAELERRRDDLRTGRTIAESWIEARARFLAL